MTSVSLIKDVSLPPQNHTVSTPVVFTPVSRILKEFLSIFAASIMTVGYPTFVSQWHLQVQWLSCSEITSSKGEAHSQYMIIALTYLKNKIQMEWKMTKVEAVSLKAKLRSGRLSNNEGSDNLGQNQIGNIKSFLEILLRLVELCA